MKHDHYCYAPETRCAECGLDAALWDEYECHGPDWEARERRPPQMTRVLRLKQQLYSALSEAIAWCFEHEQWQRMAKLQRLQEQLM